MSEHSFNVQLLLKHKQVRLGALILSFIAVFVIGTITIIKYHTVHQLRTYESELKKTVSVIPSLEQQKKTLIKLTEDDEKKLAKVKKLTSSERNSPLAYLREIARIIPDTIFLQSFKISAKHALELRGNAANLQDIQRFANLLNKSKIFSTTRPVFMEHLSDNTINFALTAQG